MFRSVLLMVAVCLWAPEVFASGIVDPTSDTRTGCEREFILFEFITTESINDVKARFESVSVFYGWKVYGAGHYFIVVENDQSEALKDLTLPADSMHTASVLPVQTLPTFMQRLGIAASGPELNVASNANLTFSEWTLKTEGLNEDQYRAAMREQLIQAQASGVFPIVAGFVAVGYLPTQVKILWQGNDCRNADFVLNYNDALGGPGGVRTRLLKIHTI